MHRWPRVRRSLLACLPQAPTRLLVREAEVEVWSETESMSLEHRFKSSI